MSFWGFRPYVTVARRRAEALKAIEKLRKKGRALSPVAIEGRKIAKSFWGKAWCDNLERYSDFANRLPRGRSYVSNGLVIDLKVGRGRIDALVSGSDLYEVRIDIDVAAPSRWTAICADCSGSVGSIVELLQGKLSKHVMERVCREADGLFPAPKEIRMTCSCPDWAGMCKHVAATLYSVGARLDHEPDVLFALRGVKREDLVSVGADLSIADAGAQSERVLVDDDVAALFGIEFDDAAPPARSSPAQGKAGIEAKKRKPVLSEPAASRRRARQATDEPAPDPRGKAVRTGARSEAPATTADGSRPKRRRSAAPKPEGMTPEAAITPKSIKAKAASPAREPSATRGRARASNSDTKAASASSGGARERPIAGPPPRKTSPEGRTRAAKWIGAKARKSARK